MTDDDPVVPGTFEISVDVPEEVREQLREQVGEDATKQEIDHALADRFTWEWGPQPEFGD